jgi:uncharacterized protein DUF4236
MWFPFSRRVSLIPGLRVNLSKSGASLSVAAAALDWPLTIFFGQIPLFRAKKILRVAHRIANTLTAAASSGSQSRPNSNGPARR